jgi:glucan phosphoethanolaminetransferase (alkaline phosphatase superfamily)
MRAVASILSIILFLAFATTGAQKMIFNTMASKAAEHMGLMKRTFQLVGLLEVLGALGVMIGLAAKKGTFLALLNEAAATGLLVTMVAAIVFHFRKGDGLKGSLPALVLGAVCLIELVLRLV